MISAKKENEKAAGTILGKISIHNELQKMDSYDMQLGRF
jgi:hypothetical protein